MWNLIVWDYCMYSNIYTYHVQTGSYVRFVCTDRMNMLCIRHTPPVNPNAWIVIDPVFLLLLYLVWSFAVFSSGQSQFKFQSYSVVSSDFVFNIFLYYMVQFGLWLIYYLCCITTFYGPLRLIAHILYGSRTDGDMSYSYLMHTSNDVVLQ